jgi:DNA modification methylase
MQVRALRLADNRLVEIGAWDQEKLATELSDLIEIDFDVSLSGFEAPEAELIIERQFSMVGETTANQIPIPDESQPPISRRGDVFRLGEHRAMCGDAKDANDYKRLLNASVADVVLTDPPYGCKIRHHVSGAGRIKHREFIEASNDMSDQEFTEFLYPAVRNLAAFSTNGSLHYVFIDWRNIYLVEGICRQLYDKHLNTAVWVKNQPSLGSFLRSQHEFCLIYRNGPAPHRNNVQLGRFGRNRSNCWFYEGANSPSPERRAELRLHPTVKSVEMFADILRDSSGRGDLALDPFLGSGTTVIAAEMTQRVCYGLELDPLYLDTIVRRWEAFTGAQAIHDETGLTFQELATARQSSQLLLPPPQASVGEG